MDFQDLSVKGRAMEQSSRLPRESSFASRSMSREPPIIPEERHPKAPRSLAAPPPIDKAVGPMGFVKVQQVSSCLSGTFCWLESFGRSTAIAKIRLFFNAALQFLSLACRWPGQVVIHGLKIQDLATCYCVLQCSNYWVRTHVISLDARSKWPVLAFVIPLWVPDEQVRTTKF